MNATLTAPTSAQLQASGFPIPMPNMPCAICGTVTTAPLCCHECAMIFAALSREDQARCHTPGFVLRPWLPEQRALRASLCTIAERAHIAANCGNGRADALRAIRDLARAALAGWTPAEDPAEAGPMFAGRGVR